MSLLDAYTKNMKVYEENMKLYRELTGAVEPEEKEKTMIYVKAPEKPRYFFNGIAIKDIDVVVPDKVVIVTIVDYCFGFGFNPNGYKYKMVCQEGDEFSLEKAVYIAIAKRLFSEYYTFAGVMKKAEEELPYIKGFEKMVRYAISDYNKKIVNKERAEKEEADRLARIKRRKAKKEIKRAKKREDMYQKFHIEFMKKEFSKWLDEKEEDK